MLDVTIYCDGACKGNPGVGGWGAYFVHKMYRKEVWGYNAYTTNQVMELTAAINSLSLLKDKCSVTVYSDSQYLIKGMNSWMVGWKRKGWKTSTNTPVANLELWLELDKLNQFHTITWIWVKGHSGDENNEKADELANRGIVEQIEFNSSEAIYL